MASKNKKTTSTKVKQDPEEVADPANTTLRRSTRATRGSLKPVVDLTKELDADNVSEEIEKVEVAEDEEYEVEEKPKAKPGRRSSVKRETAIKKEPAKRAGRKSSVAKQDANESKVEVKKEKPVKQEEEAEEEQDDPDDLFYELNEKEMKEINHAFDMNRLGDNDEVLNTDGLRTAIRSLGFEPRGDEIKRLMKKFGKSNKVNRDGFHKTMAFKFSTTPAMKSSSRGGNDEISRVFNLLDLDKSGLITFENLKSIAKELNEDLDDEELREMIREADQDHDFMINKDEFENIMRKTSLY